MIFISADSLTGECLSEEIIQIMMSTLNDSCLLSSVIRLCPVQKKFVMKGYNMLINHNQNMLCLDEFDILELRENADECDYLFVVSPKIETKICTK